ELMSCRWKSALPVLNRGRIEGPTATARPSLLVTAHGRHGTGPDRSAPTPIISDAPGEHVLRGTAPGPALQKVLPTVQGHLRRYRPLGRRRRHARRVTARRYR